jgi:hypothetical protein
MGRMGGRKGIDSDEIEQAKPESRRGGDVM